MSEDSNVPIEQVNEMKERINVTLKRLRDELATYWTSTGEVPSFIIGKPAPILPQDALNECLLYPHRDALLDTLPKSGIVAEVGTQYGHWAEMILDVSSPKELHLFDLDFDNLNPKVNDSKNVRKHRGDSSKELSAVQDIRASLQRIQTNPSKRSSNHESPKCHEHHRKPCHRNVPLIQRATAFDSPAKAMP